MNVDVPALLMILKEVCQSTGYQWELADETSKNLAKISHKGATFYASNGQVGCYPTNLNFAVQLAKDKAWTYEILRKNGYKIPSGKGFLLVDEWKGYRSQGNQIKEALNFAETIGYPVFVKPNQGSLGRLANVVNHDQALQEHLEKIKSQDYIAIVQEKITAPEYRMFIVDGKVEFIYERKKSEGASSANLSQGGRIENYTEEISEKTQKWGKKLAENFNLSVCGIDFFSSELKGDPNEFIVIEINGNPSLEGIYNLGKKEKVHDIWQKILKTYFTSNS